MVWSGLFIGTLASSDKKYRKILVFNTRLKGRFGQLQHCSSPNPDTHRVQSK